MDITRWMVFILVQILFLSSAQSMRLCARWFNNGEILERPQKNPYINVETPGTAELLGQFAYLMLEGHRSRIEGAGEAPQSPKGFLQTLVARIDPTDETYGDSVPKKVQTLVMNSDIANLTDTNFSPTYARDHLRRTLRYLYDKRYALQGEGRSRNLDRFGRQDARKAKRTVGFTHLVNDQEVSHIQVEVSRSRHQPLNFQEMLVVEGKVDIPLDQTVAELERFHLVKPRHLSPETRATMSDLRLDRDLLFYRTLQKPLSWINQDAEIPRVFYYCTEAVSKSLEAELPWLKVVKKYRAHQKGNRNAREVLYDLEKMDLLMLEGMLMEKIVHHHFLQDLPVLINSVHTPVFDYSPIRWNWMFWPNEFSVLRRLKISEMGVQTSFADSLMDLINWYVGYRKEHDIFTQLRRLQEDFKIVHSIRHSLILTLDAAHIRKMAEQIFQIEFFSGPKEEEQAQSH